MVECPICSKPVKEWDINSHIDSGCESHVQTSSPPLEPSAEDNGPAASSTQTPQKPGSSNSNVAAFFQPSSVKRAAAAANANAQSESIPSVRPVPSSFSTRAASLLSGGTNAAPRNGTLTGSGIKLGASNTASPPIPQPTALTNGTKTSAPNINSNGDSNNNKRPLEPESTPASTTPAHSESPSAAKRQKVTNAFQKAAPLAERMRPRTLDEVCGQELVGPSGVLRGLIEQDRVPSMILWGGAGTGKTTIARVIAHVCGRRFVEINSTSTGVAECKKLFGEARSELGLTGRRTIIFCDEIHRFSKSQQDVFLGPVESGQVTLIGATTENPSFKVVPALLSRCRTFTLQKLDDETITEILQRALQREGHNYLPPHLLPFPLHDDSNSTLPPPQQSESSSSPPSPPPSSSSSAAHHTPNLSTSASASTSTSTSTSHISELLSPPFLSYLASFSDGDARTALNLLELSLSLISRCPHITPTQLKSSLTKTLVYDRAGDQHYDTISALHKSIRGSDPDAALYYLARMIQSGEDPLFIARRLVVVASEDVGLADNSLLPLCMAAFNAVEKIGMPEARIHLAHATVALSLAKKSTRSYRGLNNAMAAVGNEPGVAGLPIPFHIRNAPTKLMKELGYGKEYKYNPHYKDGRVKQEYLPEKLWGRKFLEDEDLGSLVDEDLVGDEVFGDE
ncbi:P-loop containing nucleoside triphosphate hydrolase protein [Xylona heveae TC161]|uniref:p-loop containing nucleoside triphosphate hydrolase protein n=1 Tax=Xylona heveae (strain CBS 132557 / TC161) TaxID=1328760 RepID=A0A165A244_XYLHT|nr:P-loop containing nucleoside triphosphate hydrolase protein [Xylona heveae TC161]KZF19846.1 P-loop containing nucleoside triphosphate hydrolase protein [Xylona heveae TC161]